MRGVRVIPTLLLKDGGVVKTKKFSNHTYVGDPVNAVKIFNEKEIDELAILDIDASKNRSEPNYELIHEIANEAFFPLSYGGGINNLEQAKKVFRIGFEKVILCSSALQRPELITEISEHAGASSVVYCINTKKNIFRDNLVFDFCTGTNTKYRPVDQAKLAQSLGAGEIIIQAVDRDGMYSGYDLNTIKEVSAAVDVPVVPLGGARDISDMKAAVDAGASAAAAGSMFIFFGKHRAVLITYPTNAELEATF
ncbi:MAG: AglZ/HisF2 family acetamidino modification protein [Rhodothermales bacterium]